MNAGIQRADPRASFAVILGCDEYPSTNFPTVPAVRGNLEDLESAFLDEKIWGLRTFQIRTMLNPESRDFISVVENYARMPKRDGMFVVYFCGHAERHHGELYLVPSDADRGRPTETMVPARRIFQAVDEQGVDVEKKLLILDCCHAGQAIKNVPSEAITGALNEGGGSGWYVMAATTAAQTADADLDYTNSLFTGALLEVMKGRADGPRTLTPRWIFEQASALIKGKQSAQQNDVAWSDSPWLRNDLFEDKPLAARVYPAPGGSAGTPLPHGFGWPARDPLHVGREEELERARERLQQGTGRILPVVGPRFAGKNAFTRALLSAPEVQKSGPPERPWLRFNAVIPDAAAESPVLKAIAEGLEIRLQDVDPEGDGVDDARRQLVVDQLAERTRGYTLLLEVDVERLGYDARIVRNELDRLLNHPFFRDVLSIVISRVEPGVSGAGELIVASAVKLTELTDAAAAELLAALAARERVTVDGGAVMAAVPDPRLRLPGILSRSASRLGDRLPSGAAELTPQDAIAVLFQWSVSGVVTSLTEANCQIMLSADADAQPGPLASLIVWALTDDLPLSESVVEIPAVEISLRTRKILEDARVLSRTDDGLLEMGQMTRQALKSLLLAALFRDATVDDPFMPLDRELNQLFGESAEPAMLDGALAAAAAELLRGAIDSTQGDDDRLRRTFRGMEWALGWIGDQADGRLPQLYGELQCLLLGHYGDELFLPMNPVSIASWMSAEATTPTGQPVAPWLLTPRRARPGAKTGGAIALSDLYRATARLTLASRASGTLTQRTDWFLGAAENFSVALSACSAEQLPASLMRSADVSLALTGHQLGVTRRLTQIRRDALPLLLAGADSVTPGRPGRITLAISWLLNTVDAQLDAGGEEEARQRVEQARSMLELLPGAASGQQKEPQSSGRQAQVQLHSRVAQISARCQVTPAERRAELRRAFEYTVLGLRLANEQGDQGYGSVWLRRLLTAGLQLIKQCWTDEEVLEVIKVIDDALVSEWGAEPEWPMNVRLTASRFLRNAYGRVSAPEAKLQGARRVVALVQPLMATVQPVLDKMHEGAVLKPLRDKIQGGRPAESGDPSTPLNTDLARILVNLAQAEAFLAGAQRSDERFGEARSSLARAEQHAREAVQVSPATATYNVWLRQVLDIHRVSSRIGPEAKRRELRRRTSIQAVREWLAGQTEVDQWHAVLDLRCTSSDWAEQGSLRRACELQPGENFDFLPPERQASLINDVYRQRVGRLNNHRNRYGESVELAITEVGLEREYQRWKAITDFIIAKRAGREVGRYPQVDNSRIFEIFRNAIDRWPSDARIQQAQAEFYRYIWNDATAVTCYERLARTAREGETWRQAKIMAAEALLAQVQHNPDLEQDRRLLLFRRAKAHLTGMVGRGRSAQLAVILSTQVSVGLGERVDWHLIDDAFNAIVGENYTGTVGRFLHERHYGAKPDSARLGMFAAADHQRLREQFGLSLPPAPALTEVQGGQESKADSVPHPGKSAAANIAELLLADFTSVDLLRSFGQLYLSRAESITPGQSVYDLREFSPAQAKLVVNYARHAYDCFDACRIVQEAADGESSVVKFLRGRAIMLGSAASSDPDPFDRIDPEGNKTMIQLANGLIHSAYNASVGEFHKVCHRYQRESSALLARFGLATPGRYGR